VINILKGRVILQVVRGKTMREKYKVYNIYKNQLRDVTKIDFIKNEIHTDPDIWLYQNCLLLKYIGKDNKNNEFYEHDILNFYKSDGKFWFSSEIVWNIYRWEVKEFPELNLNSLKPLGHYFIKYKNKYE